MVACRDQIKSPFRNRAEQSYLKLIGSPKGIADGFFSSCVSEFESVFCFVAFRSLFVT